MSLINRDVWIGIVMLLVAVVYWLEADKIRISPLDGPVGASGLPKTLAYALAVLAVIFSRDARSSVQRKRFPSNANGLPLIIE